MQRQMFVLFSGHADIQSSPGDEQSTAAELKYSVVRILIRMAPSSDASTTNLARLILANPKKDITQQKKISKITTSISYVYDPIIS